LKILESLNSLKIALKPIEQAALDLPEEVQQDFSDGLTEIRDTINKVGAILEKYYNDKNTYENMKQDLEDKMARISIYTGMDEKIKEIIIDKVIRSKDLNLLTLEGLQDFIEDRLKTSGVEDLIKKSYSKYDILKLGEAVESPESSESKKYDAGLNILRDLVTTSRGREEAIAYGVKRLMRDVTTRKYYIGLYYGLTRS
jgi:hypothetical protein